MFFNHRPLCFKLFYLLACTFVSIARLGPNKQSMMARGRYITLNNGVVMPTLAFGTAIEMENFTWRDPTAMIQLIQYAHEKLGYTHFDTSDDYPGAQAIVRKALLGKNRDSYFIATKVPGLWNPIHAYNRTASFVNHALTELNVDYVDTLLLHQPWGNCEAIQEQWRALEHAYREHSLRAIGVSNFCRSALDCIMQTATVTPHLNQVNYHIAIDDSEDLKKYCDAYGIVLQAYGATLGSEMFLAHSCSNSSAVAMAEDARSRIMNIVEAVSVKYRCTPHQILLRWLIEKKIPAIMSSSNLQHLRDNMLVFNFNLTFEDIALLDSVQVWPTVQGCGLGRTTGWGSCV